MPKPKKSIMRSLGEFVGHVVKGVRTDVTPSSPDRTVVRRAVEEETRDTETGRVTIRRTTIEEIEVDRASNPAPRDSPGDQA